MFTQYKQQQLEKAKDADVDHRKVHEKSWRLSAQINATIMINNLEPWHAYPMEGTKPRVRVANSFEAFEASSMQQVKKKFKI